MNKKALLLVFSFFFGVIYGQTEKVWLHANAGQWDKELLHQVKLDNGEMYIAEKGMIFHFHDGLHGDHNEENRVLENAENHNFKGHLIRNYFLGSSWTGALENSEASSFYSNYYIGNDPAKWKSFVRSYHKSVLKNFYPGIDMEYVAEEGSLKYSFLVAPGINPNQIKSRYEGADDVALESAGALKISHSFGSISEEKPIAWQMVDGEKVFVEVQFQLVNGEVTYDLGVYDSTKELIIDPSLTFSTFSGSTADNWGSTATPDDQGNVFGGGIVFGSGFPTSVGAYDQSFNGVTSFNQNFDVGIMKFNSSGSTLLFSTYLGGASSNEFPSSMICNANGELYVMGMTGSSDFPTVAPYDASFNGGITFSPQGGSGNIPGSDIFIARFNPNGTALLSSTFVGGSGNDGYNGSSVLKYNYGDAYRGEITLDTLGNVYVASSTTSSNFPLVGSGGQGMQGTQSAVAFKMNSTLNTMLWSRYISGSGMDAGYSIQVAYNGNVFMVGGTTSTNLNLVSGNSMSFNGGSADGYLIRLNPLTGQTINGTYIGQNEYDQAYLIQTDVQSDPYVVGQTESSYTITPGKYGNANSGQFIRKYSANLATIQWTTMIGAGSGHVELSPTAFLVSDCYDIYLAGWGGPLNASNGQAPFSSTSGFPVTSDAFQSTTLGNNFYLAVLGTNASSLKYATFFGGLTSTPKHVDGGTSRFDKQGRVYHAVCAACGGNATGFTSTPGAWSATNNSSNCNMAVFKFDLSVIVPLISVLDPLICYPEPVFFQNNTLNADQFYWTFGDGTTDTTQSPSHVFPGPGSYTVTLIASDVLGCYQADTSSFVIEVGDFQGGVIQPTDTICIGDTYQLHATGGGSYAWSPASLLDDSTSSDPFATLQSTTLFTVIISDSCGADTLTCTLNVHNESITASNDTSLCIGSSVDLSVTGGVSYSWSPTTFLSNPTSANPTCTATQTTNYIVTGTTVAGCVYVDSVLVTVFTNPPVPEIDDTINVCIYTSETITVSGGDTYQWTSSPFITPWIGSTVTLNPPSDMYFYCDFINSCGVVPDSIFADVLYPDVNAYGDTTICPDDNAVLTATGGITYEWSPVTTLSEATGNTVLSSPILNTTYQVVGTDSDGCKDTAWAVVNVFPRPTVNVQSNYLGFIGEPVLLTATSTLPGTFYWSPPDYLSCVICATTEANPDADFLYTVLFVDENSCEAIGGTEIKYEPIIYVPNTFTPDQDEFNPLFSVVYVNIKSFQLDIYDRWGALIHTMTDYANYWDGTYLNNQVCPDGVYSWKMVYYDKKEKPHTVVGHVNLVR